MRLFLLFLVSFLYLTSSASNFKIGRSLLVYFNNDTQEEAAMTFDHINKLRWCQNKIDYAVEWVNNVTTSSYLINLVTLFINYSCIVDRFFKGRFLPAIQSIGLNATDRQFLRKQYYSCLEDNYNDPTWATMNLTSNLKQLLEDNGASNETAWDEIRSVFTQAVMGKNDTVESISLSFYKQLLSAYTGLRSSYSRTYLLDPISAVDVFNTYMTQEKSFREHL